jgi:diaminopimelate epimerase
LGNDFILIDDRDKTEPSLSPQQASSLCDRHFGIGADGVIFALQSTAPSDYDFRMRIYNADATEPEMCGNGIRCLAQFVKSKDDEHQQQANSNNTPTVYRIETLAGPIVPVVHDENHITVDMGEPILDATLVPTTIPPNFDGNSVVGQTLIDINGKEWKHVSAVSMGNPHCIIFVDHLEDDVVLHVDGPALEGDVARFPARTNVEFVQVVSPNHLTMKVWERGAGPTLACGTGACALAVAAMRAKKIPRTTRDAPVRVTLPGGDLFIEWREDDNRVYMTGPATFCFRGQAKLK